MFSSQRQAIKLAAQSSRRLISTSTVENGLGASELSLIVKAGSRYEPAPGVAHLLQKFAFQDSQSRSGLRLQRESELLGGSFTTKLTKEHLVLTARFLREDLPYFVEALADTVSQPLFREYQFNEDIVPLAQAEAIKLRADPAYLAVEGAFEAAFRTGLANQLVVSEETPLTLSQVKDFASQVYTQDRISLIGRNVSQADLEKFVGSNFTKLSPTSSLSNQETKFFNGEFRVKRSGEQAAVLAFPTTTKPCLEALRYVLGGNNLKWSKGFGLLNTLPASVSVRNDTFSDCSLFYIIVKASSTDVVKEAIKTIADTIKNVAKSLDKTLADKAIASAKFDNIDTQGTVAHTLAGKPDLAKVSADSIRAAAKGLIEGKRVLSVVGKTYALPYSDDLF